MRTIVIFAFCLVVGLTSTFAQEAGKIRIGLEIGYLFPRDVYDFVIGFGISNALELKFNLKNNMNVGLRTEGAFIIKHKSYQAEILSFHFTYDYYFHKTGSCFSKFIGAGLGYYFAQTDDNGIDGPIAKLNNPTYIIRGGFENKKFRAILSYNWIIKTSEYSREKSDYISLNIGFYIGGGKWK